MPPIKTWWWLAGIGVILTVAAVGWWVVGGAIFWPQAPVPGATAGEGQGPGAPTAHVHALALDHIRNILFLGTHQGLSRSQDEGKTWSKVEVTGEVPSTDFTALAIDPTNPQTLYAAGPGLWVVKSTDGGATWALKKEWLGGHDVRALAMDRNEPQKLYAWAADKGLYRSRNGGEIWVRVDDGPRRAMSLSAADVKGLLSVNIPTGMGGIYLAAATPNGMYLSADCF